MSNKNSKLLHNTKLRRNIIVATLLALAALGVILLIIIHPSAPAPAEAPNDQPASSEPASPTADDPNVEPAADNNPEPDNPKQTVQYEGVDPNHLNTLTGNLTSRRINREHGILTIVASIDQYLSAGGTCNLTLLSGASTIYSDAQPITADITTSVCGPFEVPLTGLSSGTYNININITSGDKHGVIEGEITI